MMTLALRWAAMKTILILSSLTVRDEVSRQCPTGFFSADKTSEKQWPRGCSTGKAVPSWWLCKNLWRRLRFLQQRFLLRPAWSGFCRISPIPNLTLSFLYSPKKGEPWDTNLQIKNVLTRTRTAKTKWRISLRIFWRGWKYPLKMARRGTVYPLESQQMGSPEKMCEWIVYVYYNIQWL